MDERAPIELDPGHGLRGVAPPRRHSVGRWLALAHTTGTGAVALAFVVFGTFVGGILIVGQLVGAEMKGLDRYGAGSFYLACGAAIAIGTAFYGVFRWRRTKHFEMFRSGSATIGQIATVEVLSRAGWWRRGFGAFQFELAPNPTRGLFRVRYRYRVGGQTFESEDRIDSRHGARALAALPEPRRGDRLTVLFDADRPEHSVLALAIGEGLVDP